MSVIRQLVGLSLALFFIANAQVLRAETSEPIDFVSTTCVDVSDNFDIIVSTFENDGWVKVSNLTDNALAKQLAIAKIGVFTRGNPSREKWLSRFELRTQSAQAELQKPNQDFFRSTLLRNDSFNQPELVLVTWVKTYAHLSSIRCDYAGHVENNPESIGYINDIMEGSGLDAFLVFYEGFGLQSELPNVYRASGTLTVISKQEAEDTFDQTIPADLGYQTKLTIHIGEQVK